MQLKCGNHASGSSNFGQNVKQFLTELSSATG